MVKGTKKVEDGVVGARNWLGVLTCEKQGSRNVDFIEIGHKLTINIPIVFIQRVGLGSPRKGKRTLISHQTIKHKEALVMYAYFEAEAAPRSGLVPAKVAPRQV